MRFAVTTRHFTSGGGGTNPGGIVPSALIHQQLRIAIEAAAHEELRVAFVTTL